MTTVLALIVSVRIGWGICNPLVELKYYLLKIIKTSFLFMLLRALFQVIIIFIH